MATWLATRAPPPKPAIHLQGSRSTTTTHIAPATPFKQQQDTAPPFDPTEAELVNPRDDEPEV